MATIDEAVAKTCEKTYNGPRTVILDRGDFSDNDVMSFDDLLECLDLPECDSVVLVVSKAATND